MHALHRSQVLAFLGMSILLAGCHLPWTAGGRNTAATMVVETVAALQTSLAASQTAVEAQAMIPTQTPAPSATNTVAASPTFANPVVKTTALCWTGPGNAYPVVSAVKSGAAVEVLGVGSTVGWFVIKNPTYGDRCWIEADNLQLDPYFNTIGMKVFNPPPTPGPKETPAPTPTP